MVNWNAVNTVLLDMDGTILDLHFDNYFWHEYLPIKYAEKHGIKPAEAKLKLAPYFTEAEGKLQWYCLDYWRSVLDLNILGMKQEIAHIIAYRPNADIFLRSIKAASKKIIMITNAHRDSLSLKLKQIPMACYFDQFISSHDYGYPKETQAFWHQLASNISLDKNHTLFIDDGIHILDAAKRFGISQLLAIRCPDSKKPALKTGGYNAINDFKEILISNA